MRDLSIIACEVSGCRQTSVATSCCSRIYTQTLCTASIIKVPVIVDVPKEVKNEVLFCKKFQNFINFRFSFESDCMQV